MRRIFIKPIDGRRPVFPSSRRPVPEKGIEVNTSIYWDRRAADGDLTISDPKPAKPARATRSAGAAEEG